MEIRKAIQRLGWRFSEAAKKPDLTFKVNQNDIDALKKIDTYVSKSQAQQFVDQELFAKLYIYLYMKILENDKTTVLDTIPRKKIYNLLKKSIPDLIEEFKVSLNNTEYEILMDELGVKGYQKLTDAECEAKGVNKGSYLAPKEDPSEVERIKEALKDPAKEKIFMRESWEYEETAECLEAEVNQAINYHTK